MSLQHLGLNTMNYSHCFRVSDCFVMRLIRLYNKLYRLYFFLSVKILNAFLKNMLMLFILLCLLLELSQKCPLVWPLCTSVTFLDFKSEPVSDAENSEEAEKKKASVIPLPHGR